MNIHDLVKTIETLKDTRKIIAIAGAPASGKSTLAQTLQKLIPNSAVLAMDGFHFDDSILIERGDLAKKGAPHTFDIDGFKSILARIAHGETDIAVPIFDRSLELSRNCAVLIPKTADTIIVEGNYLLLDDPNWAMCRQYFDLTVKLHVELETIHARLIERWRRFGYNDASAAKKINENDLPNAKLVVEKSITADIVFHENQP